MSNISIDPKIKKALKKFLYEHKLKDSVDLVEQLILDIYEERVDQSDVNQRLKSIYRNIGESKK